MHVNEMVGDAGTPPTDPLYDASHADEKHNNGKVKQKKKSTEKGFPPANT